MIANRKDKQRVLIEMITAEKKDIAVGGENYELGD